MADTRTNQVTFVMIKPNSNGTLTQEKIDAILASMDQHGLTIGEQYTVESMGSDFLVDHYAEHREKPFYPGLIDDLIGKSFHFVLVSGINAVEVCRNFAMTQIRTNRSFVEMDTDGKPLNQSFNGIHTSDSQSAAIREIENVAKHFPRSSIAEFITRYQYRFLKERQNSPETQMGQDQ